MEDRLAVRRAFGCSRSPMPAWLMVLGWLTASPPGAASLPVSAAWAAARQDPAAQQAPGRIDGRVADLGTGEAVEGATVELAPWGGEAGEPAKPDSTRAAEVAGGDGSRAVSATDRVGLFRFVEIVPGDYRLTVTHVAYGSFAERVLVRPGEQVALRVSLSPTAIELEPVTVSVAAAESERDRGLGTSVRRLTAAELAPIARSGDHLANALARLLPGVRVRSGRSQPGELVCLEFRDPASLAVPGCRSPVVVVDNVRQANALITLNTLPVANIRSVQAIGPGEAGVRFGADSSYGAIVIETFAAGPLGDPGPPGEGSAGQPSQALLSDGGDRLSRGTYNWALEPDPYPWGRALGLAALANAAGLAVGYAASRSCLGFDDLSDHFTGGRCGFAGNAGARMVLYAGPQIGVGYVAGRVGATSLSQGSAWKNAVAGAVMAAPGIVLAVSNDDDGFPASTEIGVVMAMVAAPVAAVLADRLFRRVRR